jgi:hypothetical protein
VTKTAGTLRGGFCGTKPRRIELFGAKQLRVAPDGRRWLCSADGAYPADDPEGVEHQIIGVATHVARRPWRKLPPMATLEFARAIGAPRLVALPPSRGDRFSIVAH